MAVLVARTRGGGVGSLAEFPAPRGAQRCVGAPAPQVAYEVDEAPWQRELRDVTCFFFFFFTQSEPSSKRGVCPPCQDPGICILKGVFSESAATRQPGIHKTTGSKTH